MAATPDISVIVAARDAATTLPALLESLGRQTIGRERLQPIVVDNGSRDGTGDVARKWGATVVAEPQPGLARARNRGFEQALAPLIAFTDADVVAAPDWLEHLVACLGRAPLTGGPVPIVTGEPPTPIEHLETLWRFPRQAEVAREEGWVVGANLGIRREAFAAIGGFDTSFRYFGEDVDLCLRAKKAGFRLAFCPNAVVEHPAETKLWPVLRRAFRYAASDDHLKRAHGRGGGRQWRHPGPLVRGDWALRRFGVDPAELAPQRRRHLLLLARIEYAARMAGSAWTELYLRPR